MMSIFVFIYLLKLKLTTSRDIQLRSSYKTRNVSVIEHPCDKHIENNKDDQEIHFEDSVRLQYKTLPYPIFTERQLKQEETYYNRTITPESILKVYIDNDIEILNHFLFKGKRDAR